MLMGEWYFLVMLLTCDFIIQSHVALN